MLPEPRKGDLQSQLPPQSQRKHLYHPQCVFFRPKALSCKGKEVENVFNIRTPEDANRVVKLATSKNVVIVGASFLGERSRCGVRSHVSLASCRRSRSLALFVAAQL